MPFTLPLASAAALRRLLTQGGLVSSAIELDSIADLRATTVTGLASGAQATVAGHSAPGDGGGGVFWYDAASTDNDNDGTVVGKWRRVLVDALSVAHFGVFPHETTDQTATLQVAIDVAASLKVSLHVPAGTYRVLNLFIRANSTIRGAGPETVFKLIDGGVNWNMAMRTEGTQTSGVDNATLSDFTVHGNSQEHGLSGNQMHGIGILGEHDNWTIERVISRDTGGDGIWITAASGTLIPSNIQILSHTAINCGRQDIAIVNVNGCNVEGCSGDGTFDIEANNETETCVNITVNNLRYHAINIGTRGALNGSTRNDGVVASNLVSTWKVHIVAVGYGVISGITAGDTVVISECYRCQIDGIVAPAIQITSPNGRFCRECTVSDSTVTGAGSEVYGVSFNNSINCTLRGAEITTSNASSDGISVLNNSDPGAGVTLFSDVVVRSHVRYGVYFVNAASLDSTKFIMSNVRVLTVGTNPIMFTSGSATCNGELLIRNCEVTGAPSLPRPRILDIDGLVINGNYNLVIPNGAGWKAHLHNVRFVRTTAGTPTISFNGSTEVAELTIGKVWQRGSGGFSLTGTIGFASGKTAWIDGPIVEATTWADALGSNIRAGSMYRLRGNTTNWGYTHNGTAWQAKAH